MSDTSGHHPGGMQTPKTGLAITAMVLGIIGLCVSPLGLVALVLGIVALVLANKGGEYGGKPMAITGIVTGGISVLVMPVLLIALLLPSLSTARSTAQRIGAEFDVQMIIQGLNSYALDDEDGGLPAGPDWMSELVDGGYIAGDELDLLTELDADGRSVLFLVPDAADRDDASAVVLFSDTDIESGDPAGGGLVGYWDGTAEWLPEPEFSDTIADVRDGAVPAIP